MSPLRRWSALVLAPFLALQGACTETSSSGGATLTVAVTDASSDELESFEVDFFSIRLFDGGGGTVDVLVNRPPAQEAPGRRVAGRQRRRPAVSSAAA